VTTKLTTNPLGQETTATVMTAKDLKAAIKYRACLTTMVRFQARHRVRDNIRAQGHKISQYSAKDIAQLVEDYLAVPEQREAIVENVKPWVNDFLFKKR